MFLRAEGTAELEKKKKAEDLIKLILFVGLDMMLLLTCHFGEILLV
jgi:hypothetical protein